MIVKVFIVGSAIAQLLFVVRFALSKWRQRELGPLVMIYEGAILLIMALVVWSNFWSTPPDWVRTVVWCVIMIMFYGKFFVMHSIQREGRIRARSESRS